MREGGIKAIFFLLLVAISVRSVIALSDLYAFFLDGVAFRFGSEIGSWRYINQNVFLLSNFALLIFVLCGWLIPAMALNSRVVFGAGSLILLFALVAFSM